MTGARAHPSAPPIPAPAAEAPGLWSLPLPIPYSPIGFVFTYALAHADGILLVDAGYDHDDAWRALVDGLATFGTRLEDVTDVILTHGHPDHTGLAERIRAASGARIAIPLLEAPSPSQRPRASFVDEVAAELRLCGVPDEVFEEMVDISRQFHDDALVADRLLESDDVVARGGLELRALHTPGHARGHLCLLDAPGRRVFSGDLLVPAGELQLGLVSEPDDDPVRELEQSLRRIASLPVDAAYPGHQHVVRDVPGLVRSMLDDARRGVAETARAAEELGACTAWDVTPLLPWGKPWDHTGVIGRRFAVMQVLPRLRRAARERGWAVEPGPPERFTPG